MSSTDNPQFEPQPANDETPSVPTLVPTIPPHNKVLESQAPPVENPVWNGWDVLVIAGLFLVNLFVLELLIAGAAWKFVYLGSSFGEVLQKPTLALISQFVAYIALAAYMVMLVQGKYHRPFLQEIRWNWPKTNLSVLMLGFVGMLTVLLDALSRYLPMPKSTPFEQFFARPVDAYLLSIFAITLGPLMEEFFFRGFLYPVLVRRVGIISAVFLTSVPFGLIHYVQYGKAWSAVLVIFLVGVVLTTVRAVTKSVAASFLVHVGYNGTLMILAAVATDGFRHMEKAALVMF